MRTLQQWIHWAELGGGARWIVRAAVFVGLVALTLVAGYKQFRGAISEETLRQADVGWQLAHGEGFSTRVKHPQTAAWLEARGESWADRDSFPELHLPPLYPLAIAGALAVIPSDRRDALFNATPVPPQGFGGDYVLLALNVALLWLAGWLAYRLARRLFNRTVALVALGGVALSLGLWQATVAIGGAPLAMVLGLALFHAMAWAEDRLAASRAAWPAWCAAGAVCGALFLTDYPSGVTLLVVASYAAWRTRSTLPAALVIVAALVVAAPWLARNLTLTGNPVALAWHDVALRRGDPTAEPADWRARLAADAPEISLPKLGHKALAGVEAAWGGGLWSGGGLAFTAFFVAGCLYPFRNTTANRLRWLAVALLLVLVPVTGALNGGEGQRLPVQTLAPLVIVFGAGFFQVLATSSLGAGRLRWAVAGLLFVQLLPLGRDLLEPRRVHFSYPPYYPSLFVGLREELARRGGARPVALMADVPAGMAWYGGRSTWARTTTLADFYRLSLDEPIHALLLTAHTLDRPFFSELTRDPAGAGSSASGNATTATGARLGSWAQVHTGLLNDRYPPAFPLKHSQKLADNLVVLLDPSIAGDP